MRIPALLGNISIIVNHCFSLFEFVYETRTHSFDEDVLYRFAPFGLGGGPFADHTIERAIYTFVSEVEVRVEKLK